MKPVVAAKTDVGRVRQGNEDSYLVKAPLFAVADGMGGHIAGDVASATAVDMIAERADEAMPRNTAELASIVRGANTAIWEKAQNDPALRGMGTTCTLALLNDHKIHIAHVGDSRAYLYRGQELSQITEDHTLVSRMVREGRLKPEEAERHPQRSIITRALGVDADVEVDELSMEVAEGDRLLLCSDGLTSMIGNEDLHEVLSTQPDPTAAAEELVARALEAGGEDNVTVVLIDLADVGSASSVTHTSSDDRPTPITQRETTEPDVERAPAVDTGVHRVPDEIAQVGPVDVAPRRRRWGLVVIPLAVVLLLAGGAYAAARYTLNNSYFIGADSSGTVTIYRGIPENIMGFSLKEPEEPTDVAVEDLPEFLRSNVEEGIKAESLEDAREKVQNLEARSQDSEFTKPASGDSGGKDN
ncbi:MAG: Stp1/IreP family PP2C-type Ser/Thr phosphatase [Actinomycetota bacterium]